MNLQQMSTLKRWHVEHKDDAPFEYHAWDAVLTLWVLGWMGLPPALVLDGAALVPLCAALWFVPPAYVALRRRLHDRGRLRCDWLPALA
jgi:hypothetical protein